MRGLAFALSVLLATGAGAQQVTSANTGVLRALDKNTGRVQDIELSKGQRAVMGRISIEMQDCRYPNGNPSGNAYAYLDIREKGKDTAVFQGWMVASAPALNPMDHPRYDVWVLRCKTS